MTTYKPRILGIIYEAGNFNPLLALAKRGQKSGEFDMMLWSPYALPEGERYRSEAIQAGSVYIEETTSVGSLGDIHGVLSSWLSVKPPRLPVQAGDSKSRIFQHKSAADKILMGLNPDDRLDCLRAADLCERRTRFCEDWLVRLGIDTVLFAEDNVERDSFAWIAAARRRGVKTVVSSYGALSAQEAETAYAHSSSHQLEPRHQQAVRKHLPHWVRQGADYMITRLPFSELMGRELFGTAPFDPWLVNSNGADHLALESDAMVKIYLDHGFQSGQLIALGNPMHDRLAHIREQRQDQRTQLAQRHGFNPESPLIVVAMPPDQRSTRPCPFDSYEQIMEAFGQCPEHETGAAVIVSPHPNMNQDQKDSFILKGGHLEHVSVAELLPLADLYIACVSSTIKWALGLGIPVIDFDCYGYNYPDYHQLPQVLSVSTKEDFLAGLTDWHSPEKRASLEAAATNGAAKWGGIDGNCLERLETLCLKEVD